MAQKLKGIYDALDRGNYKSACKLCTGFLQKHPQHGLCRSLHAVALERCDHRDEALQECEEALRLDGTDDTVLSTVQVVFKRCHEPGRITMMYESASLKQPDNEDLAKHLFASAVRGSDFAKAQQVATRLYSKFKKSKYLHWVVVSLLLQKQRSSHQSSGADPMALAAMMLRKAPVNTECHAEGAELSFHRGDQHLLLLHLAVLRLSGDHAKVSQMLEECKSLVRLPGDLSAMRVRFLTDAGEYEGALREARSAVVRNPDCWASAQEYIDLAFRCPLAAETLPRKTCIGGAVSVEIPDHGSRLRSNGPLPTCGTMSELQSHYTDDEVWNAFLLFRYFQQQAMGRGRVSRLAELELRRRTFCSNEDAALAIWACAPSGVTYWKDVVDDGDLRDFIQSLGQYVARNGAKNFCFFDLKPFFHVLEWPDMGTILEEAKDGSEAFVARTQYACQRHSNNGRELDQSIETAVQWFERWSGGRRTEQAEGTLANTTPSTGEEFLVLSLMTLLDLDREICLRPAVVHRAYIMDAITIAEMAAPSMPLCFHISVLLVLLYGSIGCPDAMMKWYAKMDTKNIQHETLSYLVFDVLSTCGTREHCRNVSRSVLAFHDEMEKDSADAITLAFRTGIYNRIPEYVDTLTKVSKSILWGRAVVEEALFDLSQAPTFDGLVESFAKHSLLLARVAKIEANSWEVRNQDRGLFDGMRILPLCTPLGSSPFFSTARRSSFMMGAALAWETPPGPCTGATSSSFAQSAAESLLLEGLRLSPGSRLRLTSSILWASSLLLQHGVASRDRLAQALAGASQAFTELGMDVDGDLQQIGVLPLLCPWRCAFAVCQAAESIAHAVSSSDPSWTFAESKLNAATAYVQTAVGRLRTDVGGDTPALELSTALADGGEIMKLVWGFINACAAALLPVACWCTTVLPKAGSGKKVKEGQEGLHAVRVALRNLLSVAQSTLAEIHAGLCAAPTSCHELRGGLWARPAELRDVLASEAVRAAEVRGWLRASISEGHARLLLETAEAVGFQLALLKSRGAFKP